MGCLRKKSGSNGETTKLVDFLDPPNFLKKAIMIKERAADKIVQSSMRKSHKGRCKTIRNQSLMLKAAFPLFRVSFLVQDMAKDACLGLFLFQRLKFILERVSLLRRLIFFHGVTMIVTGLTMAFAIQTNNAVIDFTSTKYNCCVIWILRGVLFLGTIFMPIILVLKTARISVEKRKIVANWRKSKKTENDTVSEENVRGNTETGEEENEEVSSVSRAWLSYKMLDLKKRQLMELYSTLKSVEVSLEGVPQMFIISTLTAVTYLLPNTSHLGLVEDDSPTSYLYLGWSLFSSYASVISSYIGSMNLKKDLQLDVPKKILLGFAFSFQLLARLLLLTNIAISALPQNDIDAPLRDASLNVNYATLLLLMPILLHWTLLLIFYNISNVPVFKQMTRWGKTLHILGNTWVSFPARSTEQPDQHFKAKEHVTLLVLSGLNIATTCTVAALLMDERAPRFWLDLPTLQEFLLFVGLPSIISHVFGCLLLALFYNQCHTFSSLAKTREKECCSCSCCWSTSVCLCITCDPEEAIKVEKGLWEL